MVCVLPIGSYEQHGPHLPPTVDTEVALYVAKKVAEAVGAEVLPPVAYSCSREHLGVGKTISIKCHSFLSYLEDLLRGAVEICQKVVVVVGHGGVVDAARVLATQINYDLGPRVFVIPVWKYIKIRDHAGSDETSIYIAIGGSTVAPIPHLCEGDVSLFDLAPVRMMSRSGVVGCVDPAEVTRERGVQLLEKGLGEIIKKVKEFLTLHIS
ncbi:MAG: creatininase family protein [Pyrobaculum sp.]